MSLPNDPTEKIIIALDGMNPDEVLSFISKLPNLRWVKIGLELFLSSGPDFLKRLHDMGFKIFLDLKFHDIPVTMASACSQAAKTGAEFISVHACAGSKALFEANNVAIQSAIDEGFPPPTLLAVTVLTSWSSESFERELGIKQPLDNRVLSLVNLAVESGIGGCVCSPLEVNLVRSIYKTPFEIITPGIRLRSNPIGDQSRIMSPSEAIKAGASKLVIGRPITLAREPVEAFNQFIKEIELA